MTGDDEEGPQEQPVSEPTVEQPPATGPSGTAVLPPVPDDEQKPVWAGRAAVPTPPQEFQPEYEAVPAQASRGALIPVLVTICVMLLLGVFALGIWLILANRTQPTPAGPPTPTASAPTSAPTAAQTSATPATVVVPRVTDGTVARAQDDLRRLGLVPEVREEHNEADAGTVLGTDPPEGTAVQPGSHVTIIVSVGPEPAPTTTAPTPTPTASAS